MPARRMMGIIAVAVLLAFLSVFIGEKREKKRIQNAAHKIKKDDGGIMAFAGLVLGGVVGAGVFQASQVT